MDTQQAPQFIFRLEQVLKGVLIEFFKKGLDRFLHCRAQATAGCDPAVTRRTFAFDHRKIRFHRTDDFSHHDLVRRFSQAQPSVAASNGFQVGLPKLVSYFMRWFFEMSKRSATSSMVTRRFGWSPTSINRRRA